MICIYSDIFVSFNGAFNRHSILLTKNLIIEKKDVKNVKQQLRKKKEEVFFLAEK